MKTTWSFFVILTTAGLLCATAHAGVYDDAAAWWHLDYAPQYNPAETNVAVIDEIRDQLDWGTAAAKGSGGHHATAIRGPLGGPLWIQAPVVCPAGGQRFGDYSLMFTQETNALGQIWPDAVKIDNFKLGGSSAIVTRFYWNGLAYSASYPGWIYNNSLDWTWRKGWMFGVRGDGGNRLGMYVGQTAFYLTSTSVMTGKWYDAAAVLTDNGPTNTDTVELYLWPENGTLYYQKYTTSAVTNEVGGSGGVIGSESFQDTYSSPTNSNSGKSFKGLLNHLAVWDRALSYEEVLEAFCYPQPLIQIGVNNGKDADLRLESEADAEYCKDDPWHSMRRAVSASHPDVTLKIPLTDIQTNLNYVFHLNTLNMSQPNLKAKLQLIVNATETRMQTARTNQDLFWPIPKEELVAGTNSFTLHYAGGTSSYVTFDWMELGASWQVGTNNYSPGEFIGEGSAGDDFYITDPNWKHLERAIVQGSDSNTVLHFVLSPEMVSNVVFSYTTRVVSQGRNTGTLPAPPYPFCIGVNGRILYQTTTGVADNTLVTIPFAKGDLRSGDNAINLMFNSTNGWIQFDFHRLDAEMWTIPWPDGILFSLH